MTEGTTTFAYDSLESIRKRLLDLSSRNALLNYKFPRGKSLQFIETTPNALFKALSDKKTIDLVPIPKPTDAEIKAYYQNEGKKDLNLKDVVPTVESWAKHLGYQTSFDLQQNDFCTSIHSNSNCLQSLLYPKDLETRIKHIKQQAESSLSETGSNVLYIAIGFLEWSESKDSSMRRLAPLFTLPVKIEKKAKTRNGGYDGFEISLLDDGLLSNVTLHEKLENEFGLALPLLDEDITPEDYFNLIEKNIVAHEKGWKIQRKACMCLLNFTKQAMYQDLDPSIWPESSSIEQHPVIQQLFSKVAKERESHSFDSEYEIDEIADINDKFPIIYDADSSQHSALIDAVKGENLVIEGPPGSGKSQTITNLIAAAINNGKKVLFVAEKMAALNVVKDRLDKADLGGFCLELHSHKSNKLKILQDLSDQYKKLGQYTRPNQLQVTKNKLDLCKSNLNQYVNSVNKEWGATKLTVHEILAKAAKLKRLLDTNPEEVLIDNLNISTLSQEEIYTYIDCGRLLENAFIQTRDQSVDKNIFKHYWFGINKINLIDSDKVEIINSLKQWNTELKSIQSLINEVYSIDDFNLQYVENIVLTSDKLPEYDEEISYELIHQLNSKIDILEEYINLYSIINKNYNEISSTFDEKFLESLDIHQINDIKKIINKSDKIDKIISFNELVDVIDRLENIKKSLIDLSPDVELIKNNIPYELKGVFGYSQEKFKDMELLVTHLKSLPFELLKIRNEVFDEFNIDQFILEFEPVFNQLQTIYPDCKEIYNIDKLPDLNDLEVNYRNVCIGGFFKYFTRRWWKARKFIIGMSKNENIPFIEIQNSFAKLIDFRKNIDIADSLNKKYQIIGHMYDGVNTPLNDIKTLREWYKGIRNDYGVGFDERVKIGSAILRLESNLIKSIVEEYDRKVAPKIKISLNLLEEFSSLYKDKIKGLESIHEIIDETSDTSSTLYDLKELKNNLQALIINKNNSLLTIENTLNLFNENLHNLIRFEEIKGSHLEISNEWELKEFKGRVNHREVSRADKTLSLLKVISDCDDIVKHKLLDILNSESYKNFKEVNSKIASHLNNENKFKIKFKDYSKADESWIELHKTSFENLIKRNNLALDNQDWIFTWSNYQSVKSKAEFLGLKNIIEKLENESLKSSSLIDTVQLSIYCSLAKHIINTDKLIQKFNGMELSTMVGDFKNYDNELIALQRKQIASNAATVNVPQGIASGLVSDLTEYSLIAKEASKKIRHIPIRSLLERAPNAIQALKPCFMMSPMSVAQYLKPGLFDFDLVIMDEASQILPEDAIGALARGKSAIIVGDPKQLPPTNFFNISINLDGNNQQDLVGVEDAESILDSVSMFKQRRLRWHYRSRHQSLIAFSNKHFYDSDLILFPSARQSSPELGIRFRKVSGTFNSGRNHEEAQAVVDEVCELILQDTDESIGIVAMNSDQRDEIENQLELKLSKNSLFQSLYDKKMKSFEPIFIKNLENVQGDERDVIVISMTYGPSQIGGKVFQRFGPINQSSGWRRLNVLFTRSKKRMHIISSMSSTDILTSDTSGKGLTALKAFLRYCETGFLHEEKQTGKAPDSDFEIAVINALAKHGYECEPQLGVAGYFLDIAVKNPNNPGEYLLAVECDGATYHSAKSSRDRDRLRQQILESLGWKIHRIWSTDWFKNSQEQMQILLEKLSNLKPPVDNNRVETNIKLLKASVEENQYALTFDDVAGDFNDFVEVNDLVKYEDSRTPEKLVSVTISNSFKSFHDGITSSNSPLGQVLLGLTIGESSVLSLPSGDVNITVKDIIKFKVDA